MVDPENRTLALLREMREELASMRQETNARFDKVDKRLDAMHLNGMKALEGFIGHRTMVERAMANFDDQVSRPEQRVAVLEQAPA